MRPFIKINLMNNSLHSIFASMLLMGGPFHTAQTMDSDITYKDQNPSLSKENQLPPSKENVVKKKRVIAEEKNKNQSKRLKNTDNSKLIEIREQALEEYRLAINYTEDLRLNDKFTLTRNKTLNEEERKSLFINLIFTNKSVRDAFIVYLEEKYPKFLNSKKTTKSYIKSFQTGPIVLNNDYLLKLDADSINTYYIKFPPKKFEKFISLKETEKSLYRRKDFNFVKEMNSGNFEQHVRQSQENFERQKKNIEVQLGDGESVLREIFIISATAALSEIIKSCKEQTLNEMGTTYKRMVHDEILSHYEEEDINHSIMQFNREEAPKKMIITYATGEWIANDRINNIIDFIDKDQIISNNDYKNDVEQDILNDFLETVNKKLQEAIQQKYHSDKAFTNTGEKLQLAGEIIECNSLDINHKYFAVGMILSCVFCNKDNCRIYHHNDKSFHEIVDELMKKNNNSDKNLFSNELINQLGISKNKVKDGTDRFPRAYLKHFQPVLMLRDDALFESEVILYTLAHGAVAYPIFFEELSTHSGLYVTSCENYNHDDDHNLDSLSIFCRTQEDNHHSPHEVLRDFSLWLYHKISDRNIFNEKEAFFAHYIMGYVLRDLYTLRFPDIYQVKEGILRSDAMKTIIHSCRNFLILEQARILNNYNAYAHEYGNLAAHLCKLFPNLEVKLFPKHLKPVKAKGSEVKEIPGYDMGLLFAIHQQMFDWVCDKVL